jgi:hypothetical protein
MWNEQHDIPGPTIIQMTLNLILNPALRAFSAGDFRMNAGFEYWPKLIKICVE